MRNLEGSIERLLYHFSEDPTIERFEPRTRLHVEPLGDLVSKRGYLESVFVKWLPFAAMVDAFQHWVYTDAPQDLATADLDAKWVELGGRFMPVVDWTSLENERESGWQQIRLLFSQPFYYIDYAFAHLGALQLWRNALDNPDTTWQAYQHALTLGDTRSLADLFEAAGAQLPFDPAFVHETMSFVTSYLDQQNV